MQPLGKPRPIVELRPGWRETVFFIEFFEQVSCDRTRFGKNQVAVFDYRRFAEGRNFFARRRRAKIFIAPVSSEIVGGPELLELTESEPQKCTQKIV